MCFNSFLIQLLELSICVTQKAFIYLIRKLQKFPIPLGDNNLLLQAELILCFGGTNPD